MNCRAISFITAVAGGILLASSAQAETAKLEFPSPSPACTLKQRVGLTDIEISYSRPSVKGRVIFGNLVPYGKVWRTGANQATTLVLSTPVKLNGTEIPAGTHAIVTIPGKDEWTVIINKGADNWGAYKYDEKADIARIKVTPVKIDHAVETMAINVDDIKEDSATIDIVWDHTKVPVKLEVNFVDKLLADIKSVMDSDSKDKPYFQAAAFYYNHGQDLPTAKKWIDLALADKDPFYMVFMKAQILAKMGDKAGALTAAKHSLELSEKANDHAYVLLNTDLIKTLN